MDSEDQAGVLNRTLGYEIATLLMNRPMDRSEIQSLLPYENIHDTQVERIIDACYEKGIFEVTAERGPDKFELDRSQFNQMGLRVINIKAVTRMISPADERGGSIEIEDMPDEFFVNLSRERARDSGLHHDDYPNLESLFRRPENSTSDEEDS